MKRILALLLVVAMISTLFAGCGKTEEPAAAPTAAPVAEESAAEPVAEPAAEPEEVIEPIALKLGTTAWPGTTNYDAAVRFKEAVESVSGGLITIEIYENSLLGTAAQHCTQLSVGTLDFFLTGLDSGCIMTNGEDFAIFDTPYMFDDLDHLVRFTDSEYFAKMCADVEAGCNIRFMGLLNGLLPRGLNTKKPINSVEDIKNLKIRVAETPTMFDVWQALGAIPTIIGSGVYSALESGVVDAQENDIVGSYTNSMLEVCNYYQEINYIQQALCIYASSERMNKLNETQLGWIDAALDQVYEEFTAFLYDSYEQTKTEIVEAGYVINEDCDVESIRAACADVVADMAGTYFSQEVYDAVMACK